MTNKQKLEKLLQYYMDCYAHCEGSGCWDVPAMQGFGIQSGLCAAWYYRLKEEDDDTDVTDFLPAPAGMRPDWYWWETPYDVASNQQRRAAIKVRIDYMIKHL